MDLSYSSTELSGNTACSGQYFNHAIMYHCDSISNFLWLIANKLDLVLITILFIMMNDPLVGEAGKKFVSGKEGRRFKYRVGHIWHNVANGLELLRHFFKSSCIDWVQWGGDGPANSLHYSGNAASRMKDFVDSTWYMNSTFNMPF